MKVVLLRDVPKLGKKGEVVNASDGYVRNFLIPRGLAVEDTKEVLQKLEEERKEEERLKQKMRAESETLLSELKKHLFKIQVKAGESGKLFGSLTNNDIAEVISKTLGREFDKKWISLDKPIKEIGIYDVTVKLPGNVSGKIKVEVVQKD